MSMSSIAIDSGSALIQGEDETSQVKTVPTDPCKYSLSLGQFASILSNGHKSTGNKFMLLAKESVDLGILVFWFVRISKASEYCYERYELRFYQIEHFSDQFLHIQNPHQVWSTDRLLPWRR